MCQEKMMSAADSVVLQLKGTWKVLEIQTVSAQL